MVKLNKMSVPSKKLIDNSMPITHALYLYEFVCIYNKHFINASYFRGDRECT